MLHKETVVQEILDLVKELQKNPLLDGFYLAGGTSLALQLGHRTSTDIDLFSFKEDKFYELNGFFSKNPERYDVTKSDKGFLRLFVNGIKIELIYDDSGKLLCDPIKKNGIICLSVKDVAPMKLKAAVNRNKGRDYVDLAYLLKDFSLRELFDLYRQKYGNVNLNIIKRELLTKVHNIKEDEWLVGIKLLKNDINVKDIPLIIKNAVMEYNKSEDIGKKNTMGLKDNEGNPITVCDKELFSDKKNISKLICKDINNNTLYVLQYIENKKLVSHFFKNDFNKMDAEKYMLKINKLT